MTHTPDALARTIRQTDARALLVPPRILRRVIKKARGLGGLGLRVPHPHLCIIRCDDLLRIATPAELLLDGNLLSDVVILLPRPHDALVAKVGQPAALRECWRLLFHAHVHLAFAQARAAGFDRTTLRERIERVGLLAFEEAREVLRQEHALFDPADDAEVYEEFACVWLELKRFAPHRRADFFPAVLDADAIDAVFALDVDDNALFATTRPEGAAEPTQGEEPEPKEGPYVPEDEDRRAPGALRLRAEEMAKTGNAVRSAILYQKAIAKAPATQAGPLHAAARHELERLTVRLGRALLFPDRLRDDWERGLLALLGPAARGFWSAEARLLYDLQKVCVDNEREIFAVDLVEWFVTWFQRPIKRLLPDQPLVLTVKNLRAALARLAKARIDDAERDSLRELIQQSLARAELELRQRLQPRLVAALDAVGLVPGNAAERLSRDRLVEELFDLVVRRCFLTMSDLRDAIARSRVKLPDLINPVEFFTGDPLIRLNRRLAADLEGTYRRGEIYLRWLQRLSSIFFGNPVGRAVTLYLLLPLLGAFFIIKGTNVLMEEAHKFLGWPSYHPYSTQGDPYASGEMVGPPVSFTSRAPEIGDLHALFGVEEKWFHVGVYGCMAVFLLLMLHWPSFRHVVLRMLHLVWLGLCALFYDLPRAFLRLDFVRAISQSRVYLLLWAFAVKPALCVLPIAALLWWLGVPWDRLALLCGPAFLLCAAIINTRPGLVAQETTADWTMRSAQTIRQDVLPGLFRVVIYVFRRLLERVDQVIYTVDEWMRFRTGQSMAAFYAKLLLGFVWFLLTYVIRFAVNLLIEPQINPIKHFPVVTVSHKLSLLLIAPVSAATGLPEGMVALLLGLVPGIFGFLAWELKENWKLYRANGSPTLDAEMVGSHGEHVIHLLRPGFHSGTLPKLFAKSRRAHGASYRKAQDDVHHVAEALHHFFERELIAVLSASKVWGVSASVAVGKLNLATNRIRAELCCPAVAGDSVLLDLECRAGRLVARVERLGWLMTLSDAQRAAFADALAGLYKKAGVDLVAEDADGTPFGETPLSWQTWVVTWQRDEAGEPHDPPALPGVTLLVAQAARL